VDVMSVERTLPSSTGGVLALADYIVVSQVWSLAIVIAYIPTYVLLSVHKFLDSYL
jgi:hypothetical protein